MVDYLQSLLMIILEIFCCKLFYEAFGKKREVNKKIVNVIQFIIFGCAIYVVAHFWFERFLIKQLINIMIITGIMFWYLEISIKKSLVLCILYEGLLLLVDYIVFSINSKLFLNQESISSFYLIEGLIVVVFGKVILFFCIIIIKKHFEKTRTDRMLDSEWLKFLAFPMFTIIIIAAVLSTFSYVETARQANVLFIIAFGMAGMNIMVFYLINHIIDRSIQIHENQIFQLQVKEKMEMYQTMLENFNQQKQRTHEYKNQILCIKSLLHKKQYLNLEEYINTIYGNLKKEVDAINTNNVIVNAIINAKYQEATEKGIVFVLRVNDLSDLKIKDEDIVVILSNLLNNALEATDKCSHKKIVKVKFIKEEKNVIISVKNTFEHCLNYENNELKSTKEWNKEEHGIGIKNIIKTIQKYEGSYSIQQKGTEFCFSIMIPI